MRTGKLDSLEKRQNQKLNAKRSTKACYPEYTEKIQNSTSDPISNGQRPSQTHQQSCTYGKHVRKYLHRVTKEMQIKSVRSKHVSIRMAQI